MKRRKRKNRTDPERDRASTRRDLALASFEGTADGNGDMGRKNAEKPWRARAALIEASVEPRPTGLTDNLADLPPELLKELSIGQLDTLEQQIVAVFEGEGGGANLDQVLIGLYRKFRVVQTRRFVQNKIWRMVRKGRLAKTKGERGVFTLVAAKARKKRAG
jgi:hypothetical protein